MHFSFRRPAPAAWAARLPQLQRSRDGTRAPAPTPPPPDPGGLLLSLTGTPITVSARPRDVVAHPAAAERLAPSALVGAVLACDAENRALRTRLHARKAELEEMKAAMAAHVVEDAELRGRLRTLEEVVAALHANLEDLRLQRDQLLAIGRTNGQ